MDQNLVSMIDRLRMSGAQPHEVKRTLIQEGHDPELTFTEYLRVPTKDGRTRAQINPGDPHEQRNL